MCSEIWPEREGRRHARVEARYDDLLAISTAVLLVEAVIGGIAYFVWQETLETPVRAYSAIGLMLAAVAAPFVLAPAAVALVALSGVLVLPSMVGAAWCGRRFSGREVWWWVPLTAGAVAVPVVVAGASGWAVGPWTALAGWGAVTVALTVPALVTRRMLLPDRPALSARAMLGRVALGGTLAVVTAWAAAGAALHAGIGYEPPEVSAELLTGVWSEGEGGGLTLAADGSATADRVETFGDETVTGRCSGTGTWTYAPGDGPWAQEVVVAVEGCELSPWRVYGTPDHPKLFVHVGDPDAGEIHVLRRGGRG
ncbi:hypothetical protein [Streptomyces sp. NPDC058955]|uniref:hypothetical protein n=1 Tax=unclassified Streptomyces TaxID=2593676 RepID=UPI003651EFA5